MNFQSTTKSVSSCVLLTKVRHTFGQGTIASRWRSHTLLQKGGKFQPSYTSTVSLANLYWSDAGFLNKTSPFRSSGWSSNILSSPVRLTNPTASPQPKANEKSPWVTNPKRTLEQWDTTPGSGSGHKPRIRSSWLVKVTFVVSEVIFWAAFLIFSLFLISFCFRTTFLNTSLCLGSCGPQKFLSLLSWSKSSFDGMQIMACNSGLPLLRRVKQTQTSALG